MDQVKVALAILKKQHFWIVCGLIIIPSIVVWKMAVGSVDDQFDARKSEIESQLSKIQGIKSDTEHPNQKTIEAIEAQTDQLGNLVYVVWEDLYDRQQELNPWPEALGSAFISMINAMQEDQEFPRIKFREEYQMFISNHLPKLDEIIDRRRLPELEVGTDVGTQNPMMATGMGSMGMSPMGMSGARPRGLVEYVGITEWNDSNRNSVRGQFHMPTVPSTARIRIAQEDLWVYEAMLRVIANTNAGATGNFNAAVKRIEYLNIGQAAGGLSQGGGMYGGGMMGGGMGSMGSMEMDVDMGMEDEEGGGYMGAGMGAGMGSLASGASEGARLLQGRYVDQDGKPLGGSDAPPYAEFKMMPVRLKVVVDQGKISDLLVNCANCTMPIDVRRVSLWSKGGGTSGFNVGGTRGMGMGMGMGMGDDTGYMGGEMEMDDMGGSGMGMGMGSGMGSGMGMGMGMGDEEMGMGGYGGPSGAAAATRREPMVLISQKDIPVEIEGIIYIFNKPDKEKMGTGTEAGTAPAGLDVAQPPTIPESMPTLPAEAAPSETTPETAVPGDTQPPVDTAPITPASPTPPPAAGQGGTEPTATQPTAGVEPVTP